VNELRQLAQLGRQPFEPIEADLEHGLGQITIQSTRISYAELLELFQLADFSWQRRELIHADLKNASQVNVTIILPRLLSHFENPQFAQQTELGRKRRELVVPDLKQRDFVHQITINSLRNSHIERIEHDQVRNFARQRAKVVLADVEMLQGPHAEKRSRQLRQTHAHQLTTMCES
jgi:hypothetical protein